MIAPIEVAMAADDDADAFWHAVLPLDAAGVAPDDVVFTQPGRTADLFGQGGANLTHPIAAAPAIKPTHDVADFLNKLILHTSPERFSLAYRLLRRWRDLPHLFSIASDPDVSRGAALVKAVRRDMHKMTAFVRFREVTDGEGTPTYVSWFEPDHHIVAATAPFFVKRFASMRWSILTPRRSAHWDGAELVLGEGARISDAAPGDPLEEVWKTYYAHIFNPARLKVQAMRAQMPKKYWRNLPEAQMIAPLVQTAQARSRAMIDVGPTPDRRRLRKRSVGEPGFACCETIAATSRIGVPTPETLPGIAAALHACQRCPLHKSATQAIAGEGPENAELMIVGEQPGDQEDLAGHPFVGPAGRLLDEALQRAGIDRADAYVTNAVKHFKYEARGKQRLHKSPNVSEIDHCRWWLDQEIQLVKPRLIVGLGASAARALLRKTVAVKDVRSQVFNGADGAHVMITVHPSYLLRLRDETEKRAAWRAFLDDLSKARAWLKEQVAAA